MTKKSLLIVLTGTSLLVLALGVTAGVRRQVSDEPSAAPRACWLQGAADARPACVLKGETNGCKCDPCEYTACKSSPCIGDDCQRAPKACADACDKAAKSCRTGKAGACDEAAKPCPIGGKAGCSI